MADVQIQTTVPKEFNDVLGALVDLGISAHAGTVDLTSQLAKFISLVGEFSALPAEVQGEPWACASAASLQIVRLVQALLTPKA